MTEPVQSELREMAIERLKAKRDFQAHLIAYLCVNVLLYAIWLATGAGFPWPVFATLGWGIGVGFNAWDVYRRPIGEADIQAEMRHLGGTPA